MSDRPLLYDLFCGAGGAGMGYERAGFEVVGVDNKPQKNYPFQFIEMDAMQFLQEVIDGTRLRPDAIHASPPCQDASVASNVHKNNGVVYPNLVKPTLALLERMVIPYVLENVPRPDLPHILTLCGLSFSLPIFRHRQFASNFLLMSLPHVSHRGKRIGEGYYSIAGGSGRWKSWGTVFRNVSKGSRDEWRDAMGIDWMNRYELTQSVPPAYTEFIGNQLIRQIKVVA